MIYPSRVRINHLRDLRCHRGRRSKTSWGCKRDIRNAFLMVPVAAKDRWLLGFGWKGAFYTERCITTWALHSPFPVQPIR
jgi:hypothetical protein